MNPQFRPGVSDPSSGGDVDRERAGGSAEGGCGKRRPLSGDERHIVQDEALCAQTACHLQRIEPRLVVDRHGVADLADVRAPGKSRIYWCGLAQIAFALELVADPARVP